MIITLNLPEDLERRLSERAAKTGQTLEEYLESLAQRDVSTSAYGASATSIGYPPGMESPEVWLKAFRDMVAGFPRVDHFVDDSRESIYEGRGE
jgi:hypothetical protein